MLLLLLWLNGADPQLLQLSGSNIVESSSALATELLLVVDAHAREYGHMQSPCPHLPGRDIHSWHLSQRVCMCVVIVVDALSICSGLVWSSNNNNACVTTHTAKGRAF